jgi:hypothetical protein
VLDEHDLGESATDGTSAPSQNASSSSGNHMGRVTTAAMSTPEVEEGKGTEEEMEGLEKEGEEEEALGGLRQLALWKWHVKQNRGNWEIYCGSFQLCSPVSYLVYPLTDMCTTHLT